MKSKALDYLEERKDEIIYHYEKETNKKNRLAWTGEDFYASLIKIVQDLYPMRNNQFATDDYLSLKLGQEKRHKKYWTNKAENDLNNLETPDFIAELPEEISSDYVTSIKFYLLDAFKVDKCYGYAYFDLGSEFNRKHPLLNYCDDCIYNTKEILFHIKYDAYKIEEELEKLNQEDQLRFLIKQRTSCLNDKSFSLSLKQEFLDWCDDQKEAIKELRTIPPENTVQIDEAELIEECISKLAPLVSNTESDIRTFITNGRIVHTALHIKCKTYKHFSDALYPYWQKGIIPTKHHASWYSLIQCNVKRNEKEIPLTTISGAIHLRNN